MKEKLRKGDRVVHPHGCSVFYPAGALGTFLAYDDSGDPWVTFDAADGVDDSPHRIGINAFGVAITTGRDWCAIGCILLAESK